MKNVTKIAGIIAMVAVIALAVSCSKNEGSGGNAAEAVADAVGAIASGTAAPASDFSYRLITAEDKEISNILVADDSRVTVSISDGVIITGYTGNGGKVVIPATIEDVPVVRIGYNAFRGETQTEYRPAYEITEVVIPEGVEIIDRNAFLGCANLTTVTLPASLKYIGATAFSGCAELVNLTIPDTASFVFDRTKTMELALVFTSQKLPLKTRARLVELGHQEF